MGQKRAQNRADMPVHLPDHDPIGPEPGARSFYVDCLHHLTRGGTPFLLGGTYALNVFTGIDRSTKDLDVFCRPGDYPRILADLISRLLRAGWRMGWDSNPRDACTPAGFQDRCLQPLGHPSVVPISAPK